MSRASSISSPRPPLNRILPRLRLPVVLITLGVVLYYAIFLSVGVPYHGVDFDWAPDDSAVVAHFLDDSPAARSLRVGDVLLAIDDRPATRLDWRPLFDPLQPSYAYTVRRGDQILQFVIPVASPTPRVILQRVAASIVGLAAWAIGALIVLFASP